MTEEHKIRIGLNDQVAIGVLGDMSEHFQDIIGVYGCMFIDIYGAFNIDLELSLDDVKFLKQQYGWAIVSYCDMDQDSGQDYVYLADHD